MHHTSFRSAPLYEPIILTSDTIKKVLNASPAVKARDQWGWRLREYFLPLFNDTECADLLTSLIFNPIANGEFTFPFPERSAGGKLFAISKAPKKGVRPIVVADAVRTLVGKALYAQLGYKERLAAYFTESHPRVFQFAVGTHHGATTAHHTIQALLGALPSVPDPHGSDPIALVSEDITNAFNELSREQISTTISNQRGQYGTNLFSPIRPFLKTFYGRIGLLRYTAPDGSIIHLNSEEGTHQGDVWSPALFAATIHPTVCTVLDNYQDVVAVLWADNLHFVGPLSQACRAARDLRNLLLPLGLHLNADETIAYVPNIQGNLPLQQSLQASINTLFPNGDFPIRLVPEGVKILGIPFGPKPFVDAELSKIVQKIEQDLPKLSPLTDGLMHFHLPFSR